MWENLPVRKMNDSVLLMPDRLGRVLSARRGVNQLLCRQLYSPMLHPVTVCAKAL
jgi:hypothetical protein